MELSENTLGVLKNFANINSNILIENGNTLRTISEARNVLSRATVTEDFPIKFGIYDLNEFLSSTSLFKTPIIDFQDQYLEYQAQNNLFRFLLLL